MDSLTQITLGAACAEIVAGKKIGNRAMLWGAIAGTIPDLDVFFGGLMTEAQNLAFHRGISHSFFFAILFSFLIAWGAKSFYDRQWHKPKISRGIGLGLVVVFFLLVMSILNLLSRELQIPNPWMIFVPAILLMGFFTYRAYTKYFTKEQAEVKLSYAHWYAMFFTAIVTHPILDAFTSYGTLWFAPFSKYRVSFHNISVADPFYTVPFLGFLIAAMFFHRSNKTRRILLYIGVGWSILYMAYTFTNKVRVHKIFKQSLVEQGIEYDRMLATPSIFQNFLWHCVAEKKDTIYDGFYSFFDEEPVVKNMIKLPKQHYLLDDLAEEEAVQIVKWFSDGWYTVLRRSDGRLQINDMRYGLFGVETQGEDDFIFNFILDKNEDGEWDIIDPRGGPPSDQQEDFMKDFFERVGGI